MDLSDAIQKLYAEKESLIRAISALEALHRIPRRVPERFAGPGAAANR